MIEIWVISISSCGERGLPFIVVHGFLTAVAFLALGHRLWAHGLQYLQHGGGGAGGQASAIVAHRPSWRHVDSSQTRDRTRVPCIGRQILIYYATWEVRVSFFKIRFRWN